MELFRHCGVAHSNKIVEVWKAVPLLFLWPRIALGIGLLYFWPLLLLRVLAVGLDHYTAALVVICLVLSLCLYSIRGISAANVERTAHILFLLYHAGAFISLISNAQVRSNPMLFSPVETCSQCNSPACFAFVAGYSGRAFPLLLTRDIRLRDFVGVELFSRIEQQERP